MPVNFKNEIRIIYRLKTHLNAPPQLGARAYKDKIDHQKVG